MTGVLTDSNAAGGPPAIGTRPTAVFVRALRDRNAELMRLYSGMNTSVNQICAGYEEAGLQRLAGFLRLTADAGRRATDELIRSAPSAQPAVGIDLSGFR